MGKPMRIRVSVDGPVTTVKALMAHEMETGLRKNSKGEKVPAHHITEIVATLNGSKEVFNAEIGAAVAKNPFFAFSFKGAKKGDKLTIKWVDNKGDSRTDEVTIP